MTVTLEGEVNGCCVECGRALDLTTSRPCSSPRPRFGFHPDWLWESECVDEDCSTVTPILASLDDTRWPHRAYKNCAVDGCINVGIYRMCNDDMALLSERLRGDILLNKPGAVSEAKKIIGKRFFITFGD